MGYLNQCYLEVDQQVNAQLILLSRRNRHRAGVRMHCRGIDEHGNVANYVETEQVGNNKNKNKRNRIKFIELFLFLSLDFMYRE